MLKIQKASAGSGKTYTLTKEYLQLLLGRRLTDGSWRLRSESDFRSGWIMPHSRILAVTFTNKATEEMTSRIINELAALSGSNINVKSEYRKDFLRLFNTDRATLRRTAAAALSDLLHNFSWFNVSTIDAFFQRVLSTFERELELPQNANTEISDSYPLAVAVNTMINAVNHVGDRGRNNRYIAHWLDTYMKKLALEGSASNLMSRSGSLHGKLLAMIHTLYSESYKMNRAEIDAYLDDPERLIRFARHVSDPSQLDSYYRDAVAKTRRFLDSANKLSGRYGGGFEKIFDRDTFAATSLSQMPKGIDKVKRGDWDGIFNKGAINSADVYDAGLAAVEAQLAFHSRTQFYRTLSRQVYYLGLFGQVHRFLEEYRQQTDTLLLSDTNELLHRIISEQETPFIYERMGSYIEHYLIDEFQDTSRMQWGNLEPLILESLSHNRDNLIIGDEKQSIYRFRNADPNLLGSEVERSVERRFTNMTELHGVDISENCNWRSSADVVRFNNTLFHAMAAELSPDWPRGAVADTYRTLIQRVSDPHIGLPGYIDIDFVCQAEANTEAQDSADTEELMMQHMVAAISRQLSAGYQPKDIAVLTRKRSEGTRVILRLMEEMAKPEWPHGIIPISSADSMSVSMSGAVRMIVNVLQLLSQPLKVYRKEGEVDEDGLPTGWIDDDLTTGEANADIITNHAFRRYRLLHRFELSLYDTTPALDAEGNPLTDEAGEPLMRRLTPNEALARAIEATSLPLGHAGCDERQRNIDHVILELNAMNSLSLLDITEQIIKRFVPAQARSRENAFIAAFQDMVLDFEERGDNNIRHFLQWWQRTGRNENVSSPEGLNAITVMTIHKAKGLEYDCVHLPYMSDAMVSYNSPRKISIGWYRLPTDYFAPLDTADVPPLMPLANDRSNDYYEPVKEQFKYWENEQQIDQLNVTYVAMTRAVRELCIYIDRLTDPDKPKRLVSDYILAGIRRASAEFVTQSGVGNEARNWLMPLMPFFQEGTESTPPHFTIGSPTTPYKEKKNEEIDPDEEDPALVAREFGRLEASLPDGEFVEIDASTLLDEYGITGHPDLKAVVDDFEDLRSFDINKPRHRGIFLHEVLSRISKPSDLPLMLARTAYRYQVSKAEADECGHLLAAALADPRVAGWFEGCRAVNEQSLLSADGFRRPDRIVFLPNGEVVVVDYKFGTAPAEKYFGQVRNYIKLLRQAGYSNVSGYLWYPLTGEIILVPKWRPPQPQ